MRQPVPFQGPIISYTGVSDRPYGIGLDDSENQALLDILNNPHYLAFEAKLDELRKNVDEDDRPKRGRPIKYSARMLLGPITTALVHNLPLVAGYRRFYSRDELRAHCGLRPLAPGERKRLKKVRSEEFRLWDAPAPSRVAGFAASLMADEELRKEVLAALRDALLSVAAEVVHRHNVPTNWVTLDGKRALAGNESRGRNADTEVEVHSRGNGEESFNQRYHYPAALAAVPLLIYSAVRAPDSETTHWKEEGLPAVRDNGKLLAKKVMALQEADGVPEGESWHPGLERAAIASDRALVGKDAVQTMLDCGFYPAVVEPLKDPPLVGTYTAVRNGSETVIYPIREDGSLLCPYCYSSVDEPERKPLEVLQGEFGDYIRVRCQEPFCPGPRSDEKIQLRARDKDYVLPGSTISRGERSPIDIAMLPTWSDQYVCRRWLARQHIEWVHGQFERLFGLGSKNKDWHRRKVLKGPPNEFWYALAAVIWNIVLSHNLAEGHAQIVAVPERGAAKTIQGFVKGYWANAARVQERKESKRQAEQERLDKRLRKELEKHMRPRRTRTQKKQPARVNG